MTIDFPITPEMNLRVGVDIVRVERIRTAVRRRGAGFMRRIWTPDELSYCKNDDDWNYESLTARYAAKEAVAKALGTGLWGPEGVTFLDIEVYRDIEVDPRNEAERTSRGEPKYVGPSHLRLSGKARARYLALNGSSAGISLSHDGEYAVAFCVIEIEHDGMRIKT